MPLSFAACEMFMLLFDVLLFHPKLNLRRRDDADEGVVGSSGLDTCGGVSLLGGALVNFWARGPVNLTGFCSPAEPVALRSPTVLARGIHERSPFFGRDDETKGDVCLSCRPFTGIGFVDSAPLPSN